MRQYICGSAQHSYAAVNVGAVAGQIADTQYRSGEIPWFRGEKTDPWDHVESAMGLSIGGYAAEAGRAFEWLAENQLPDGSWFSAYRQGQPENRTRESHMAAYIAVGVYHYHLIHKDENFLKKMWPSVEAALGFATGLQAKTGEIHWAVSPEGKPDPMALLTASNSVYMSLKCGLAIARILGYERPQWEESLCRLGHAIRCCPHLFNIAKSRYSMDWFYPVLSGAVTGAAAQKRIDRYWKKFVINAQGVRCVSDRPWVTVAESSEFCIALAAMGKSGQAEIIFNWISDKKYEDGSYWCGYTWPDMTIWPEDRISWTNAVVLMAADAIYHLTPASRLFCHQSWEKTGIGE